MKTLIYLVRRHCKVYFKDKATFFTSLITPAILLVLYATFLAKVYHDSIMASFPEGMEVSETLINATVGGVLLSSLLAVSCVTVAFCVNLVMVKDRADGIRQDLTVAPIKSSTLALSYFISSLISTLIVCYVATALGLIWLSTMGWYLDFLDILGIIGSVFLLSLFGTSLASLVNCRLTTNGQASAIGTMVSSGYGFICGAYMPLASFSEGLRNILSFLPGTYGTVMMRSATLTAPFNEMAAQGIPTELIDSIKDSIDYNLYAFGNHITVPTMVAVVVIATLVFIGAYILLNSIRKKA